MFGANFLFFTIFAFAPVAFASLEQGKFDYEFTKVSGCFLRLLLSTVNVDITHSFIMCPRNEKRVIIL